MSIPQQGLPGVFQMPLVDQNGNCTTPWAAFFINLWTRSGGVSGSISGALDTLSNVAGAMLYRDATQWTGLPPSTQYKVLVMGPLYPGWSVLGGANFGSQASNNFFAAPSAGAGFPVFRLLAPADLNSVAGQIPGTSTNDNAGSGRVGEYVSDSVTSPVSLSSGVAADIGSVILSAGDWDVWGNLVTGPAGTTTQSNIKAWISTASATDPGAPNNGAYVDLQTAIAAGLSQCLPVGMTRISLAATTTVRLSASVAFAISTLGAYGFIGARRAR